MSFDANDQWLAENPAKAARIAREEVAEDVARTVAVYHKVRKLYEDLETELATNGIDDRKLADAADLLLAGIASALGDCRRELVRLEVSEEDLDAK